MHTNWCVLIEIGMIKILIGIIGHCTALTKETYFSSYIQNEFKNQLIEKIGYWDNFAMYYQILLWESFCDVVTKEKGWFKFKQKVLKFP